MHTEINFRFTPRANAALKGETSTRFASEEMPQLMPGDLFSTEELMPHVFVVTRRYFHWVTPSHLELEYLLDLQA